MAPKGSKRQISPFLGSPGVEFSLSTVRDRMEMIAKAEWATDLSWGEVVRIAQFFDACTVDADNYVFREGDREAYMCLIVSGRIAVYKRTRQDADQLITEMGAGTTFGEMSIIDGKARSASVKTIEDTTLLVLTEQSFARLTEEAPRLVLHIVLRMTRMMSQRLRETSGSLAEYLAS